MAPSPRNSLLVVVSLIGDRARKPVVIFNQTTCAFSRVTLTGLYEQVMLVKIVFRKWAKGLGMHTFGRVYYIGNGSICRIYFTLPSSSSVIITFFSFCLFDYIDMRIFFLSMRSVARPSCLFTFS